MTIYDLAMQVWENCIDPASLAGGYTVEDAAADLDNFQSDGWELPEGITAENFAAAMNEILAELSDK